MLPLDQALTVIFVAEWITIKYVYRHTRSRALWVNTQLFAFLCMCVLLCAALGPIGLMLDLSLALGALVYILRSEA